MPEIKRSVVLGLGNTINRDEGVGVHMLPLLQKRIGARSSAEFLDGGTLGLNLLPLVEECRHLLLLDAVNTGKSGASVVVFKGEEIPLFAHVKLSQHQLTFQEVLGLAQIRGNLPPQLHLVGVQPVDTSMGFGLTEEVEQAVPRALDLAEAVLRSWGLISEP